MSEFGSDNYRYDEVIEEIADYALNKSAFSVEAYRMASICLMDTIGCGFEALKSSECRKLLGPVIPGLEIETGTRVPGTSYKLDPVTAAFNIGVMNRWMEFNDTWLAAEWGHPSDNLGAILGLSDWLSRDRVRHNRPPIYISEILDCLIRAYEIQGVLCLENAFNKIGIDHVIFVKISSTAVACRLLGLSKEQTCAAISNAFIDGHPLRVYRHAPNAGTRKSWAAGDATSRSVSLALLADRGEMGYRTALSTPKWGFDEAVFRNKTIVIRPKFGEMVVSDILFKVPFPAEYHAQTAVEAAIITHNLLVKSSKSTEDIASVKILTQKPAIDIIDKQGPLTNSADRDHCMQYMVAVALIFGSLTTDDFDGITASDNAVDDLRARISCVENPIFTADYYLPGKRSIANTLQVIMKDGSHLPDLTIEYPIGHKARRDEAIPLLVKKFELSAQSIFSRLQIDAFIENFFDVEQLSKISVSEFMDSLQV